MNSNLDLPVTLSSQNSPEPEKGLHEKCGVFGILSPEDKNLGKILYYGLYAIQHRGQESCGMAVFDNFDLRIHKDMGLLNQVFSDNILSKMTGRVGIGHTRYSTSGDSNLDNAQPAVARTPLGALTLAHNGNLINVAEMRAFLEEQGFFGFGATDTHLMLQYMRYALNKQQAQGTVSLLQAVKETLTYCKGAYSLVTAIGDTLIAARDPNGLRPLALGRTENGSTVIASETCALDIVGATYERDIAPGEIFVVRQDGTEESIFLEGPKTNNFCIFELVYFARPDSNIMGSSVYTYRLNLGRRLAQISPPVDVDFVTPVPDSGNVAAVGYSQESGIPYVEGLIKNRYVGRTFINPTHELREKGIQLKLNPLKDVLAGKKIVIIDDSIVRGNTSRKIVKMLRECGVKEIHLRISSAPVKHPCYYGIDMSQESELIANKMSVDELRDWLGVDSLVYLSTEDMREVANLSTSCTACFSGDYPAGKPSDAGLTEVSC